MEIDQKFIVVRVLDGGSGVNCFVDIVSPDNIEVDEEFECILSVGGSYLHSRPHWLDSCDHEEHEKGIENARKVISSIRDTFGQPDEQTTVRGWGTCDMTWNIKWSEEKYETIKNIFESL